MKIKKAVIPVAGLGTRFLPYTKAVPKEMLPIVDVPAIHLIVEEAIKSGIKEILFVTSENKKSIPEYFKKDKKLEKMLKEKGKYKILRELKNVPSDFKASYIIQKKARGLGDAVLHAEKFAAGDSFAVFLPDDIIFSKKPVMKQMIEAFEKHKKHVVS
ncbi:MAG: sugar phosphate nucleotidyltransferase, partial [bacterium]